MRITDTWQLFRESDVYPADAATVAERFGDVEIESPTGETATVGSVLARSHATSYGSARDVYTALIGTVDESFIGRKYYDDRGDNQPDADGAWYSVPD